VAFRDIRIGESVYHVFSKAVDLKGVGQMRILISYDSEEFSGSPAYFATDQIRWEGTGIIKTYSKRWHIEAFFRDSNQNLGLEDYQLRDLRGIKRHWYLIFLAYSLLVSGLSGMPRNVRKEFPTLGGLINAATRNVFADLVGWIALLLNRGQSAGEVCRIAYGF
jgi:hypothetical protein